MSSTSLIKQVVCTAVIVMAACLTVDGQTIRSPDLQQSAIRRAYIKLLHARIFNFGGVGFGQTITEEEKAFRVIFESVDAENLFLRLAREASAEGQLYALFGLRARGSFSFEAEVQRLRNSEEPPPPPHELSFLPKGQVRVGSGCLLYDQNMKKAVDGIAKGEWDAAFSRSQPALIQPPKN